MLPIDLPKGGERVNEKEAQSLEILIDARGTLFLKGKVVSRSRLKESVNRELAKRKVRDVFLRADRAVTLQRLVPVLDALRTTNARSVSIETLPQPAIARQPPAPPGRRPGGRSK